MKKVILSIAALAALAMTGCANFLDVQTEGLVTTDNYFNNDQQAIDAIDKLYIYLGDEYICSQDIHWDDCCTTQMVGVRAGDCSSWFNHFNLNFAGDIGTLPSYYEICYQYISYSNWVVSSLLKKEAGTTLTDVENRSLGEAYFLRAFWHYLAALRYGCKDLGVPFVKYEDFEGDYDYSMPPQQASVTDNYRMMIEDFTEAEARLSKVTEYDAANRGRASKESAVAMMARIYTYWATFDSSKWDEVISCVNKLESTYGRKLAPTYDILFTDEPSEYFSDEYCWGYACTGYGNGGGIWFEEVCIASGMLGFFDGWGEFNATANLYEAMLEDGEGNDRLVRSIKHVGETVNFEGEEVEVQPQYGDQTETGFFINKWTDSFRHADAYNVYYTDCRINMMYHFCRFADCLLYRAEAYLAKGQAANAATDLNAIRKRSGLSTDCTGTWAELFHERYCELAFEGGSWFHEIKRWAVAGASEIKALAIAELESHPDSWIYKKNDAGEWQFDHKEAFGLYKGEKTWADYKFSLPYPVTEITNSNGAYRQPTGY